MKAEILQAEINAINQELTKRKLYNSPYQLFVYRKLKRKKTKQLNQLPKPITSPQLKLL